MSAIRMERWQSPAALREVAVPSPGPGEVLVKGSARVQVFP